MHYNLAVTGKTKSNVRVDLTFFLSRLRTIIAALHCNILIRKEDLVRNLDYVANVLEAVHQDETR